MKPRSPEVCPHCGHRLEEQGTPVPVPELREDEAPETFEALIETMRRREQCVAEENGKGDSQEPKSWRSVAGGKDSA